MLATATAQYEESETEAAEEAAAAVDPAVEPWADPPDPEATKLQEAYREFDQNLRVFRAKTSYIMGMILIPAGITLDYFVYPKLSLKFFYARLVCDLVLVPFLVLLFTPIAKRWAHWLDKPIMLLPAVCMCWMVYAAEGPISPYYAGLNLIVVAVCILIPLTAREAISVCGFILICYALACMLHHRAGGAIAADVATGTAGTALSLLYNNIYFLLLTSMISVAACHHASNRRFEDFRLRHELAVNNTRLETTLTKLKETEVQLVQSEKMGALGKLSAGLLHEVNNPLNFTFMALQMAQQEAEGNADLKETLDDIHQGMTRIKGVISDLRTFAYPTVLSGTEPFVLSEALTTAMRLTSHEMGGIPIDGTAVEGKRVRGSKTQLAHVFMNLLMNSAHAVRTPGLGREPRITVTCEPKGDRLQVHVRDNGCGIKPKDMPRLFEPFFTTKEVGQGTGLGLSICHTIIRNHGGSMRVASEEKHWTQFTFDLAIAEEEG
jgi:two-component system sensor histidine kinase PhcS